MDISNKHVVIATHYLVYGAPQALRDYFLLKKIKRLLFIAHPLKVDNTNSYREVIEEGRVVQKKESRIRTYISIFNYFIESFLTVFWVFQEKNTVDIFFGVDPLNAAVGILLKKLGKVKKVTYYTIDFVPNRFGNQLLNNMYQGIDAFCLRNADETWNVSPRIAEGREKLRGLRRKDYPLQKVVPIGVWFDKVKRLPFAKIKKHQLLFVGHLLEKQGVQLVLEAMPEILKKIPDFHFLIVGGGEYEESLKSKIKSLKLQGHVTFTGWIKDRAKLDTIMADSALAIAMYDKTKDTFTYYADPTKLKDYLSAGLPILLTDVPFNAQDIQKASCGIIVQYDSKILAKAIIKVLQDEKTLHTYRNNAITYIQKFDWEKIFDRAF